MVVEISVEQFDSIEDYNFDYGFEIVSEDLDNLKTKTDTTNSIFNCRIGYVKSKNGVIFLGVSSGYQNSFFVSKDDVQIDDGYYIINSDSSSKKKLENKNDYGEGLFQLMLDTKKCEEMKTEIETYENEQEEKHSINVWCSNEIPRDWKTVFADMSKDDIIENIQTKGKTIVDETIQEKLKEEEERKEKRRSENEIDRQLSEDNIIEHSRNGIKVIVDKVKATITTYRPLDKPQARFKFKSKEYMKEKIHLSQYDLYSFGDKQKCKSLSNCETSFIFELYNEEKGIFETMLDYDIENLKFNGVKVAKAKMLFFINRVTDYGSNTKTFLRYQDKDYVEQLNKLSGIKVDVCSLKKLQVKTLDIPINVELIDKQNFMIEMMNNKKIVDWKILKENLTYGNSVHSRLSKGEFISLVRGIGISDDDIHTNLNRVKMLSKLKGTEENDD